MRTKKDTGYTLVYLNGSTLRAEYFQSKAELEESFAIEPAPVDALLFAGAQLAYTATTQTIVTIGAPTTRKGTQQPVKASELPTPRRKAAGPGLKSDGTPRKPRTVKPKVVAEPTVVQVGVNGERSEQDRENEDHARGSLT